MVSSLLQLQNCCFFWLLEFWLLSYWCTLRKIIQSKREEKKKKRNDTTRKQDEEWWGYEVPPSRPHRITEEEILHKILIHLLHVCFCFCLFWMETCCPMLLCCCCSCCYCYCIRLLLLLLHVVFVWDALCWYSSFVFRVVACLMFFVLGWVDNFMIAPKSKLLSQPLLQWSVRATSSEPPTWVVCFGSLKMVQNWPL